MQSPVCYIICMSNVSACYGVLAVTEGGWLCDPCCSGQDINAPVSSCILCPVPGGALKKAVGHQWAHITCALAIQEGHLNLQEPIKFNVRTKGLVILSL